MKRGGVKGSGTLDLEQIAAAMDLLRGGMTQRAVAERFGVTKNTIAGIWTRAGEGVARLDGAPTTLLERCAALHAQMDQALAETQVPRLPAPSRDAAKSPSTRVRRAAH